jgi:hypothetical protein
LEEAIDLSGDRQIHDDDDDNILHMGTLQKLTLRIQFNISTVNEFEHNTVVPTFNMQTVKPENRN